MINATMSCCMPGSCRSTFSAVTPHFFSLVLHNTLRDNRLLIPTKFVRKYGETLSNPVFAKLPSGSEWKMELRKSNGRFSLQKGWPEFVKYYSIGLGHFLVFRYEGNSRFHACIFDTTTVEIEYPLIRAHSDGPKREEMEDDHSVEILEDFSPYPRKRKGSPFPCSESHKKFRTSPIGKTEIKGTRRSERILKNSMRNGDLHHSKSLRVSAEEGNGDKSIMPGGRLSEVKSFTYKVVIKPSHVGKHLDMCLPRKFANEFLENKCRYAVLKLSHGRTWPVRFQSRRHNERRRGVRFEKPSWEKFARDNNLKVADTCVFESINGNEITFKVSILKADLDSHPTPAGNRSRPNSLKPKRKVKLKTEDDCTSKHQEEIKVEPGKRWQGQANRVFRNFQETLEALKQPADSHQKIPSSKS